MTDRDQILRRAARLSVAVSVVILALKVGAWIASGSAAVLSDAIESVVHVLATIVMLATLQFSQKAPDKEHPYGHGKAASFSVGFEGGLVALSGVLVLFAVVERLMSGRAVGDLTYGIVGTLAATGVNLALGLYLVRVGREHRSEVLVADGQHVLADVWTSVGVVLGLVLVWLTGLEWLDWAIAAIVGAHLVYVGSGLVRSGIAGLMDEVHEADYERVLAAVNRIRGECWLDLHDLRLRRVGDLVHVDFHLVVPGTWTVAQSQTLTAEIEAEVLAALESKGSVLVRFDPPVEGQLTRAPGEPFTLPAALRHGPSHRQGPSRRQGPSHPHDLERRSDAHDPPHRLP